MTLIPSKRAEVWCTVLLIFGCMIGKLHSLICFMQVLSLLSLPNKSAEEFLMFWDL